MGESGSSCRKPVACFMRLPGEPFRRILEDEVARRVAIQSVHLCRNPSACIVSSRKTQLTESKALEMSSLMKRDGRLDFCRAFITLYTHTKFSWIHLFLMKAFWHLETSSFSLRASRSARILVMILAMLIRLIGLESVILMASFVFGIKNTLASLIKSSFYVLSEWKACRSARTISQYFL